jgi:hypothetical protein
MELCGDFFSNRATMDIGQLQDLIGTKIQGGINRRKSPSVQQRIGTSLSEIEMMYRIHLNEL